MKIAILSPYATVNPHFEMELELVQQHIDAGDVVEYFSCTGQLSNCDFNTSKAPDACRKCELRRHMGLKLLCKKDSDRRAAIVHRPLVPLRGSTAHLRLDFDDVDDLMGYCIGNFDIGYAVLSSLVSVIRDPEPDLKLHRPLLKRFLQSAYQTYQFTDRLLKQNHFDRVYTFNGRFAAMRAVLRACQAQNVDCFLHERGCDKDHFEIYENHLPHDIQLIDQTIRKYWNAAPPSSRQLIGSQWYHDRVNRVETGWKSFVTQQKQGTLPRDFSQSKHNIAIFCSSDDEFVAIGDCWKNDLYPNQVIAVQRIALSLQHSSPNSHLWVRVHPNLMGVDNRRKQAMLSIAMPNVTIIAPEDPIDTYSLMHAADVTASFGSSVGIEAVFWDRPSVLLGPCLYQDLGGPMRSTSHRHTIELLSTETQPPQASDKTGALQYGFWFQTRGHRYQHYQAQSLFEGQFKGQTVYPQPKLSLLKRFKQTLRRTTDLKG